VKSSIVYPSVIHAHNLPILKIEKGANPGSLEACAKFFPIHPSCLEEDTVSLPRGVAVTGNPGVHLGVEYPLWSDEVLHRLTKKKFCSA
jgi:hypothetical protein